MCGVANGEGERNSISDYICGVMEEEGEGNDQYNVFF